MTTDSSIQTITDFERPNVATGSDPFRFFEYASRPDIDALVLLFQRDYHCINCRKQVQAIASRYDEFRDRRADVVSTVPESRERTATWDDQYDLPVPLLADESKGVCDAYDQPTRFGALGSIHDIVGRMPESIVVDTVGEPTIEYVHRGRLPADRPSIDDLLTAVDECRSSGESS